MRICYFGSYNLEHSRNQVISRGMEVNNIKVLYCYDRSSGLCKYWRLFKKHWSIRKRYDVMVVGFLGQSMMLLAKLICRKPIIFDALLSLYDANVFDRQICQPRSFRAFYYYFQDWFSCWLADAVLLDTNEHIDYFVKTFHLKKEKFFRLFVGCDETLFYPRPQSVKSNLGQFIVEYHGFAIPMHGIEYVIKAMKILQNLNKNVKFNYIGAGQCIRELKQLAADLQLKNVNFLGRRAKHEMPNFVAEADVSLGAFGSTEKVKRVIPCKVYEILAMKKPLITGDVVAVHELLTDRENCLLVPLMNPQAIAEAILLLKDNSALREKISQNGYKLFQQKATAKVLGQQLKEIIISFLNDKKLSNLD